MRLSLFIPLEVRRSGSGDRGRYLFPEALKYLAAVAMWFEEMP